MLDHNVHNVYGFVAGLVIVKDHVHDVGLIINQCYMLIDGVVFVGGDYDIQYGISFGRGLVAVSKCFRQVNVKKQKISGGILLNTNKRYKRIGSNESIS